jgi:hypothetical protein
MYHSNDEWLFLCQKHRYTSSRKVIGFVMDDGGSIPVSGKKFSLRHCAQSDVGTYPLSHLVSTSRSFPGVKRPESEACHQPPSIFEVKNSWSITSLSVYAFMTCPRDKCTFTFVFPASPIVTYSAFPLTVGTGQDHPDLWPI